MNVLLIFLCMMGSAFFAGIETGVISIHRMRLRHSVRQGDDASRILESFVENFDRLLGTTLVGNNVCVVISSIIATSMATRVWPNAGEAISTAVMSALILIFCEYLPKAWFHARPLERCQRFAGLLKLTEVILRPIAATILTLVRVVVPGSSRHYEKTDAFVTREDLKLLTVESEKNGALSKRERVMIHRVFELSNKQAVDIMVPLEEMVRVQSDMPIPEFLKTVRDTGFTRLPVYDREAQKFTGVINVFSVLSSGRDHSRETVRDYMRPPRFIAATSPVDELLPLMRAARQPLCLVRSDDKKVIGLLTTEDILSEIVGELAR